ncbi:MAG TPA: ABC transporter ATP-binding protein [Steroidobacteraceae bacterium]|jgi:ABC-type microcin C transport system duplicated ATPase subunit YejF|nr:ABC transporter ATP-binding protein [Steroidobacteraceae bacterium]
MSTAPLLQIRGLGVYYATAHGAVDAVNDLDLDLGAGECLGLVGESGSGKTAVLLAIMGLLSSQARLRGNIRYRGTELLGLGAPALNALRGARIAMVFQDPMSALNPYLRVIDQLSEVSRVHGGSSRRAAEQRALEMLESVQIGEPERRARQYPHQLSGGMRQRVMIAMALMAEPEIVLADEPTTALDVTVQAQILSLLQQVRARTGAALLLVTHDLGVVAQLADRVGVMRAGRLLELADCERLFASPRHAYTQTLLAALPKLELPA